MKINPINFKGGLLHKDGVYINTDAIKSFSGDYNDANKTRVVYMNGTTSLFDVNTDVFFRSFVEAKNTDYAIDLSK